jgi:hypothetical protein
MFLFPRRRESDAGYRFFSLQSSSLWYGLVLREGIKKSYLFVSLLIWYIGMYLELNWGTLKGRSRIMTRRIFCKALLVVVVVLGLFFSAGISAQGGGDSAFERVRDVQEKNTGWLMAIDDVEGTAIGFNENDQLAVKVFTAGPGVRGIPQEIDGVPVQVIVTGKFYALSQPVVPTGQQNSISEVDPTARFSRPVPIGVSTGHPLITAGTIGCRVTDGINVYALSNNHVYANSNNASIGDDVWQPGRVDGGKDGDEIGTLAAFVEIKFDGTENFVDAAIARSTTDLLDNATPSDGYDVPNSTIFVESQDDPLLGLAVQKYGRTTGLTKGSVSGVNATVNVSYGVGTAVFANQIVIFGQRGQFSRGGDSGSLIVTNDEDCKPVGLLFAGGGRRTIASPIGVALDAFGVGVDGK